MRPACRTASAATRSGWGRCCGCVRWLLSSARARLRSRAARTNRPHTLVSNPFLELTEAEADRVLEMIEEIHVTGYAVLEGLCNDEAVAALNDGLPWDGVPRMVDRLGKGADAVAWEVSSPNSDDFLSKSDDFLSKQMNVYKQLGHDTEYKGAQTKHIHTTSSPRPAPRTM